MEKKESNFTILILTLILTSTGTEYILDSPTSYMCSSLNRMVPFFQGSKVRILTLGGKFLLSPDFYTK